MFKCFTVRKINGIAKKNKLFMFENMMYFYSKQFNYLKKLLNKKNINKIDIKFSIPD
jgi:predicted dehydrogenase